jgi:Trypsin-like peptidase domain
MSSPTLVRVALATVFLFDATVGQPVAADQPYAIDRLGHYTAQVSWRFVHNDASSALVCHGKGTAIFLGGDRFLTAAHVVDQNPLTNACAAYGTADPTIEIEGAELRGRVVFAAPWVDMGGLLYPEGTDLALIAVDARMIPSELRSGALTICASDLPVDGATAVVGTQFGVFSARTQPRVNDEFARIDFPATPGHSGGGVFDPARRCLVGIVSNGGREGTNYVANQAVQRFLARSSANSMNGTPTAARGQGDVRENDAPIAPGQPTDSKGYFAHTARGNYRAPSE